MNIFLNYLPFQIYFILKKKRIIIFLLVKTVSGKLINKGINELNKKFGVDEIYKKCDKRYYKSNQFLRK